MRSFRSTLREEMSEALTSKKSHHVTATFPLIALSFTCFMLLSCSSSVKRSGPLTLGAPPTQTLSEALSALHEGESALPDPWRSCLLPLAERLDQALTHSDLMEKDSRAMSCRPLLTRPSDTPLPEFLNSEWIILDLQEELRLNLTLKPKLGVPQLRPSHQGDWELLVTLLRLPRSQTDPQLSRAQLQDHGIPSPLRAWSEATIQHAEFVFWGDDAVVHTPIPLDESATLKDLPVPRVGQALKLKLRKIPPSIQRGGWALHLPLWLNSPTLRRTLILSVPHGAKLSRFGPEPEVQTKLATENRYHWERLMSQGGEGETLYLSSIHSWSAFNRWLWSQLYSQYDAYQKLLHSSVNRSPFNRFMHSNSQGDIHRWLTQRFSYEPDPHRPYLPLAPSLLMKRKAGDCKDLSALAMSILELQGDTPRFALTSTRPLPPFASEIPSVGWFDHVLLWLPDQRTLKLAELTARSEGRMLDSPLVEYRWFDATSPQMSPQTRAQSAYVLLSPELGIWVPLDRLSKTRL